VPIRGGRAQICEDRGFLISFGLRSYLWIGALHRGALPIATKRGARMGNHSDACWNAPVNGLLLIPHDQLGLVVSTFARIPTRVFVNRVRMIEVNPKLGVIVITDFIRRRRAYLSLEPLV
jgi:hypothetical protein